MYMQLCVESASPSYRHAGLRDSLNYFLGEDHVACFGQQPMLLIKSLDAAVRLQLQAHPTAEFAKRHLNSNSGKAEAYYILDVRDAVEQAYVYL